MKCTTRRSSRTGTSSPAPVLSAPSDSGRLRSCHSVKDPISISPTRASGEGRAWVIHSPAFPRSRKSQCVPLPFSRRGEGRSTVVLHRVMQRQMHCFFSSLALLFHASCGSELGVDSPLSGSYSFPWLHSVPPLPPRGSLGHGFPLLCLRLPCFHFRGPICGLSSAFNPHETTRLSLHSSSPHHLITLIALQGHKT